MYLAAAAMLGVLGVWRIRAGLAYLRQTNKGYGNDHSRSGRGVRSLGVERYVRAPASAKAAAALLGGCFCLAAAVALVISWLT